MSKTKQYQVAMNWAMHVVRTCNYSRTSVLWWSPTGLSQSDIHSEVAIIVNMDNEATRDLLFMIEHQGRHGLFWGAYIRYPHVLCIRGLFYFVPQYP